jgi:predicted Zn-dependent protease
MTPRKLLIACLLCLVSVTGFAQQLPPNSDIENIGSRDINKGAINFYSQDKEIALGRKMSAQYEAKVRFSTNPEINEYINRLGQNIVLNSDAKTLPVTFRVVDSPELDARSFPGGFVFVNRGTIAAMDNEAELAFVLAEEIAHIAARHATEQASKNELTGRAAVPLITPTLADSVPHLGDAVRPAGDMQTRMQFAQFARKDVMEADFLAVQYIYKAGYAPDAAVTFLRKIEALEGLSANGDRRLNPFPPAAKRIAAMEKNIPLILPARTQNTLTTPEFRAIQASLKK